MALDGAKVRDIGIFHFFDDEKTKLATSHDLSDREEALKIFGGCV